MSTRPCFPSSSPHTVCSFRNAWTNPLFRWWSNQALISVLTVWIIRYAVGFGKLALNEARTISANLVAVSNHTSPTRMLVLKDQNIALQLARAYLALDRDIWPNPSHIDLYRRTGNIIHEVVHTGKLAEKSLWDFSDVYFWEMLRQVANKEQQEDMDRMAQSAMEKTQSGDTATNDQGPDS
jgi:hypothetical protein